MSLFGSLRERFDRREASKLEHASVALAVSRKRKARANVFQCQLRKIFDDFRFRHSRSEIARHIGNRQAQPADVRPTAVLGRRLDGDNSAILR